jgi:nucleoside-diphosphate-sugar epimerase
VYGDYEGEWVDERSELRAAGGKGWSRVVAEHEWLALHDSFGLPAHIFRCGGIYGAPLVRSAHPLLAPAPALPAA